MVYLDFVILLETLENIGVWYFVVLHQYKVHFGQAFIGLVHFFKGRVK